MDDLEFYGGVGEIGGNKIKLNQDNSSVFLDFGMSFNTSGSFYSNFLNPRKLNGLGDFIEMGLLPEVKGIYREDYLRHAGINYSKDASVDALLLSHAHADHANYIHHLREDIPLYMTSFSKMILEVIDVTSASMPFTDIINYKPEYTYVPKKRGSGLKKASSSDLATPRDIRIMKPYKFYDVGNLHVKSCPVDHSLPGASSFLIESDNNSTIYSGDLRFHGRNKTFTDKFVKEARSFSPSVMLCEGTRIDSKNNKTEEYIEREVYKLIINHKGLVIANYPVRDLDRLVTFYNIAKNTDRYLAINFKQAYMLKMLEKEDTIYPKLDDNHIVIYVPRKSSGRYTMDKYYNYDGTWTIPDKFDANGDYPKWQDEFLDYDNLVTYKNLKEDGSDYIFTCDYFSFNELIDIKPENGLYIHSKTEPFNEEMDIDYKREVNWLKHFNLCPIHQYHVSGHASGPSLLDMIREINPETLYPIHTEHPEKFEILKDDGINVILPKLNK